MKKKPRPSTTTSIPERRSRLRRRISHFRGQRPFLPTAFQKAVYRVVCRIPKGQTRSYKWVARKIGCPKAYRAVGNALNKNPYPGIIPCHRVIKSDGTIGGFSKGIRAKKRLLSKEAFMV